MALASEVSLTLDTRLSTFEWTDYSISLSSQPNLLKADWLLWSLAVRIDVSRASEMKTNMIIINGQPAAYYGPYLHTSALFPILFCVTYLEFMMMFGVSQAI